MSEHKLTVAFMMAFEDGNLSREEITAGFQKLINSGLAWKLQGSYGRMAAHLLDKGYCKRPETGLPLP